MGGMMTPTQPVPSASSQSFAQSADQVRRVLWIVLVLNALVAAAKLVIGIATGAVAMIADGFHSSMDASSNVVGLVGIKLAAQPPDKEHPYGHRRFETLATLAIGGLLLVAAWEIFQTLIDRLLNGGQPDVTPVSFGVMIVTIVINLGVTVYERRRGHALRSPILLADASHTASDLFVSLSVIASLAASKLGYAWADVVVALVIMVVIGRTSLAIIGQSSGILADRQTLDPADVEKLLNDVPGLDEIVRVRSRGPADAVYVDIDARINPSVTADHAYAIAKAIKERIRAAYAEIEEIQVNFAPQRNAPTDYALEARAVADGLGLGVHEIVTLPQQDGIALEMHVEVPPGLSLTEAHRQASELESRLKARLPAVQTVLTHIEPASERGSALILTQTALELRDQALARAQALFPGAQWDEPMLWLALGGYALTIRCRLPGSVSVEEAHSIAEQVESALRTELPLIQRVTIHTEPMELSEA